jgi:hypothetical protein
MHPYFIKISFTLTETKGFQILDAILHCSGFAQNGTTASHLACIVEARSPAEAEGYFLTDLRKLIPIAEGWMNFSAHAAEISADTIRFMYSRTFAGGASGVAADKPGTSKL